MTRMFQLDEQEAHLSNVNHQGVCDAWPASDRQGDPEHGRDRLRMKQKDIKPCALCGKGVMHSNQLLFWRVSLQHMAVNLGAVQRQAGLEMMMGGNHVLAHFMGPDEDMGKPLGDALEILICQECSLTDHHPIGVLAEEVAERTGANKG